MASSPRPGEQPTLRFEATLGAVPRAKALAMAADLDLDRLPDVNGKVRLLLTPADAKRLLDQGVEVHLVKALPVKPLDAKRVMSDEQARRWLEEEVRGLPRAGREAQEGQGKQNNEGER